MENGQGIGAPALGCSGLWAAAENRTTGKKGGGGMAKVIGIGNQDYGAKREEGCFYIDKTHLIKE